MPPDTDLVISGGISGAGGSITKSGSGALVQTGSNAHTGGTIVNTGLYQIGNGTVGAEISNALGSGTVTVNNATLSFAPGSTSNSYNFDNDLAVNGGTIRAEDGRQHIGSGTGKTIAIGTCISMVD